MECVYCITSNRCLNEGWRCGSETKGRAKYVINSWWPLKIAPSWSKYSRIFWSPSDIVNVPKKLTGQHLPITNVYILSLYNRRLNSICIWTYLLPFYGNWSKSQFESSFLHTSLWHHDENGVHGFDYPNTIDYI